ncbi:MAG: hypothetical protein U0X91_28325 [Spirosomataceae bacterium]
MKLLFLFYSGFFLLMSLSIQAASDYRTDTFIYSQAAIFPADSLGPKTTFEKNVPANRALWIGGVSGIIDIVGMSVLSRWNRNLHTFDTLGSLLGFWLALFFGGLVGLFALTIGVSGFVQRKRLIKKNYQNHPKASDLPLGQGKSFFSIVMGFIGIGLLVLVLVAL